jgi:cation:H+ antiporter
MILASIYLVIGFILLWFSSDRSVLYAKQASYAFHISGLFLGFMLMAIVTGLPELLVAIQATLSDTASLSVGDLIGSNFVNISLALGIPATWWGAIVVKEDFFRKQILLLGFIILIMAILFTLPTLGFMTGVFLTACYCLSLWWLWSTRHIKHETLDPNHTFIVETASKWLIAVKFLASLLLVVVAANICVEYALEIITYFGLRPEIVGATIFAFGTSLPEIILSFQAIRKKEYELALGNALGSNLANATLFLGILALSAAQPLQVNTIRHLAPFMFGAHGLVGYAIIRKRKIDKKDGIILLLLYISFILYESFNIYTRA